jgi:hypothetical protein
MVVYDDSRDSSVIFHGAESFWEANSHSAKKFSTFYGTRRFITVFTKARQFQGPV